VKVRDLEGGDDRRPELVIGIRKIKKEDEETDDGDSAEEKGRKGTAKNSVELSAT